MQDLLDELHCPYCGSGFQHEAQFSFGPPEHCYGIVRCACYRYPVIDGILVLRQPSGQADTRNRAVKSIEAGNANEALEYALTSMSPIPLTGGKKLQRSVDFLARRSSFVASTLAPIAQRPAVRRVRDEGVTFRQALTLLRPALYSNYLFHRYANNSFLASIAVLLLLKELDQAYLPDQVIDESRTGDVRQKKTSSLGNPRAKPRVLDLACGVGHSSFLITTVFPDYAVTAVDYDFVNLYIARRYLIPKVTCVCIDAEIPLPFSDSAFDAVFCLDGFHYIRSKIALLSELDRVLHEFGLWLFPHLHNARAHNFSAGVPLTYEDYMRCFEFIKPRILSETEVFQGLMKDQSLDLGHSSRPTELDGVSAFSLIGSRRTDIWHKHNNIASLMWNEKSGLSINPIYRVTNKGNSLRLQMNWPNSNLEKECAPIKKYLPFECEVDKSLWERLRSGLLGGTDELAIQELINSFVLVRLPREYDNLAVH